jgi:hypothetical protein
VSGQDRAKKANCNGARRRPGQKKAREDEEGKKRKKGKKGLIKRKRRKQLEYEKTWAKP